MRKALPAATSRWGQLLTSSRIVPLALNNRLNSAVTKVFGPDALGPFIFSPFECTLLLTLYLMLYMGRGGTASNWNRGSYGVTIVPSGIINSINPLPDPILRIKELTPVIMIESEDNAVPSP
jgi:hypothetical protein